MNRVLIAAVVLLGACSHATDPCAGTPGACVVLTVTSSQIHTSLDTLAFTATGPVTGTQTTTTTKKATLPVKVALRFGAGETGTVDLTVVASEGGGVLGDGHVGIAIPATGHTSATVDVEPQGGDGGTGDMPPPPGDGGGVDMLPASCDPHGLVGLACVWRWQTPLPVGENLRSVWAFADNDVFALSDSGAILHSDGTAWSILPARPKPAFGSFRALKMVGGVNDLYILGWTSVTGGPSDVFHSTDKGVSWVEEPLPSAATSIAGQNMTDIAVVPLSDSRVVVVGGYGHISTRASTGVWTDDQVACAGMTGCSVNFRAVTASLLDQVALYSSTGGYAGQGNTWTQFSLAGTNTYNAMCSGHDSGNSAIRYWAVGNNGVVATATQAGGPTVWSMQASPTSNLLYGCTASDQNKAWAFGANGTVIASTNGGSTWGALSSNTNALLLSGSHSPGSTLTVVGAGGVILQGDGVGAFTNKRTGPSGSFNAIYGVAPQNVYAVGTAGVIAHSTDGQSWSAITMTGSTQNLLATWGSSPTDVYAVGLAGTVLHSNDGTKFTRYSNPGSGGIPTGATLTGIAGLSASNVLVSSDQGLFRSTDKGASFLPVPILGFTGSTVYTVFVLGGDAWVGGDNGQIYHSTDGVTWASQTLTDVGAGLPITSFTGNATEIFAASADSPLLARTLDKGANWTNSIVGMAPFFRIALTPSGDHLYALSYALLVSQDSGMNFVPVTTAPVPSEIGSLFLVGDGDIYAGSTNGIVHYGN